MTIKSIYPDICSADLPASRDFYVGLLGLEIAWEADWYIALAAPGAPEMQITLVAAGHDSVPEDFQQRPAGVLMSFEVEPVTTYWERALKMGVPIAQELREEVFGQHHFMAVDPDGLLVDVIETVFVPEPS